MKRWKGLIVPLFLLIVLVMARPAYAQKGGSVKLLTYYETPLSESPFWVWAPPDPTLAKIGRSGTFVTLHIPPARGSQALIFEIDANAFFTEATGTSELQIAWANHSVEAKSKLIPPNVAVVLAWGIANTKPLPQDGIRPALAWDSFHRVVKFPLWGNAETWWWVGFVDPDTGAEQEWPPDEKAALIRKLIDNGFDLECYFRCNVKGIAEVALGYYDIFVYSTDLAPYIPPAGVLSILGRTRTRDAAIR